MEGLYELAQWVNCLKLKKKKELGMAWPVTPGEGAVTGWFLGLLPVSLSEMMVFRVH